jgi:hypothetical protein
MQGQDETSLLQVQSTLESGADRSERNGVEAEEKQNPWADAVKGDDPRSAARAAKTDFEHQQWHDYNAMQKAEYKQYENQERNYRQAASQHDDIQYAKWSASHPIPGPGMGPINPYNKAGWTQTSRNKTSQPCWQSCLLRQAKDLCHYLCDGYNWNPQNKTES